jgi:hypothetical protein
VLHDAGCGILCVGLDWTTDQAGWLQAVVAAHRQVQAMRIGIPSAFDLSHPSPIDVRRISVLLVAGYNAALATDALRHIKVKAVLLAGFRKTLGNSRDLRQRFDLVQGLHSRLWRLLAQQEPDAIVFRSFDKR